MHILNPIQSDTMYRCTIVWHDKPEYDEDVVIYAGEFPIYLHGTYVDDDVFFALPSDKFVVGMDEGAWVLTAIHEPIWSLQELSMHDRIRFWIQSLIPVRFA